MRHLSIFNLVFSKAFTIILTKIWTIGVLYTDSTINSFVLRLLLSQKKFWILFDWKANAVTL